jgi:hypothetical protein
MDEDAPTIVRTPDVAVQEPPPAAARAPQPAPHTPAPLQATAAAQPAAERLPPHTPPAPRAASLAADSGGVPAVPSAESSTELEAFEKQMQGGSRAGPVILVLLLLIAGSLVGASVALEGTPDPRPLLEDLYRQVKG